MGIDTLTVAGQAGAPSIMEAVAIWVTDGESLHDVQQLIRRGGDAEAQVWLDSNQPLNIEYNLFIVHYQSETGLLFIYSQLKTDVVYEATLLSKIQDRIKGSITTKFVRGDIRSLKELLQSTKSIEAAIYIVQPSISKSHEMKEAVSKVLSAATFYIRHTGRVKELRVWGSK